MLIDSLDKKNYAPTRYLESRTDAGQKSFRYILDRNSDNTGQGSSMADKLSGSEKRLCQTRKIHLGKLSDDTPTVSELLYNTQYKENCWEVLESDVNSSKRFRRIPEGADIYIDRATSEIVWEKDYARQGIKKDGYIQRHMTQPDMSRKLSEIDSQRAGYSFYRSGYNYNNQDYRSDSGRFRQSGQESVYRSESEPRKSGADSMKELHEAVREFMGKDYSKIDCYELVVNGLENMGVRYLGNDGLGRHLVDKALEEGLANNHYLTGEGLLDATGHRVYNKRVMSVRNPLSQAKSAMEEMETVLKEGQILSFSTRTRGHTGVISKKDGVWTFINSGYMDNNVAGENGRKQVGEEILAKEIENWFRLAGKKKDGLTITLGDIDISKLSAYREYRGSVSEKV